MTTTTMEGNRIIAEFMGYEFVTVGYFDCDDETEWQRNNSDWMDSVGMESVGDYYVNIVADKFIEADELRYNEDWNLIMEVIQRIFEIEAKNLIRMEIVSMPMFTHISIVYNRILEFINLYNKYNSQTPDNGK